MDRMGLAVMVWLAALLCLSGTVRAEDVLMYKSGICTPLTCGGGGSWSILEHPPSYDENHIYCIKNGVAYECGLKSDLRPTYTLRGLSKKQCEAMIALLPPDPSGPTFARCDP